VAYASYRFKEADGDGVDDFETGEYGDNHEGERRHPGDKAEDEDIGLDNPLFQPHCAPWPARGCVLWPLCNTISIPFDLNLTAFSRAL